MLPPVLIPSVLSAAGRRPKAAARRFQVSQTCHLRFCAPQVGGSFSQIHCFPRSPPEFLSAAGPSLGTCLPRERGEHESPRAHTLPNHVIICEPLIPASLALRDAVPAQRIFAGPRPTCGEGARWLPWRNVLLRVLAGAESIDLTQILCYNGSDAVDIAECALPITTDSWHHDTFHHLVASFGSVLPPRPYSSKQSRLLHKSDK